MVSATSRLSAKRAHVHVPTPPTAPTMLSTTRLLHLTRMVHNSVWQCSFAFQRSCFNLHRSEQGLTSIPKLKKMRWRSRSTGQMASFQMEAAIALASCSFWGPGSEREDDALSVGAHSCSTMASANVGAPPSVRATMYPAGTGTVNRKNLHHVTWEHCQNSGKVHACFCKRTEDVDHLIWLPVCGQSWHSCACFAPCKGAQVRQKSQSAQAPCSEC